MIHDHTYLYVEDDALSREALSVILTRVMKLQRVYTFEDSAHFFERLTALPVQPDIILLDIHMQPYTGFDLLKLLRAEPSFNHAKIIAVTASVMNEEVEVLKSSGFDGAIGKPINVASFPRLLERIIQGEAVWHITEA